MELYLWINVLYILIKVHSVRATLQTLEECLHVFFLVGGGVREAHPQPETFLCFITKQHDKNNTCFKFHTHKTRWWWQGPSREAEINFTFTCSSNCEGEQRPVSFLHVEISTLTRIVLLSCVAVQAGTAPSLESAWRTLSTVLCSLTATSLCLKPRIDAAWRDSLWLSPMDLWTSGMSAVCQREEQKHRERDRGAERFKVSGEWESKQQQE